MRKPYKKSISYGHFNEEALDELLQSNPHREFSLGEIAEAAETNRQTIFTIEQRAIKKIAAEIERRGLRETLLRSLPTNRRDLRHRRRFY